MSILDRVLRTRHLDETALTELWTDAAAEGRSPTHRHLAVCAQCRTRYAVFADWLTQLRDEAHAEADEAFPPDRLVAQRAHILRRLEALERPARVITFPRLTRPVTARTTGPQRWVAASAAAGLLVGLAAGQMLDLRRALERPYAIVESDARLGPSPAGNRAAGVQPAGLTDEDLFYDADARFSTAGVLPIDFITPRARDVDPR